MTDSAEKLLPCPFCGAPAHTEANPDFGIGRDWLIHAGCGPDCGAQPVILGDTEPEVMGKWNRRAHLFAQPAASVGDVNGGWISVNERLPMQGDLCEWIPISEATFTGFYYSEYFYAPGKRYTKNVVVKWRNIPLPAAPMTAASGMDEGE